MTDQETCTICLDHLHHIEYGKIKRLQPCGHYYHSECIELWQKHSNTCPTCRFDYATIEVLDDLGNITSTSTATKITPIPNDEFFESLSDAEDATNLSHDIQIERRINILISRSNSCVLCDSVNGNLTACNTCSSTFHSRCLNLSDMSDWFCPMCDAEQGIYETPSRFRRSRNSAITNRVYNSHRNFNLGDRVAMNQSTMEVREVPTPMSIEEQHAWESFEVAKKHEPETNSSRDLMKNNNESPSSLSQVRTISGTRKLKRPSRRGKTVRSTTASDDNKKEVKRTILKEVENKSLVNTILDQIKENRISRNSESVDFRVRSQSSQALSSVKFESSTSQPQSPSLLVSPNLSPVLSISMPTSPEDQSSKELSRTNKSVWKTDLDNKTSELEQKSLLQEIVRSKLRPFYKSGKIDVEQYTNINKKVSHILYDHYVNSYAANPDFEAIAESYVTQEVNAENTT